MSKWYSMDSKGNIIDEGGTPAPELNISTIKFIKKLEKVITKYIPKHTSCRFEEQKREMQRTNEKNHILDAAKEKVNMDNNPLSIEIEEVWEQNDPDMSVCKACKEVIYSTRYTLHFLLNKEKITPKTVVNLCEPCYLKANND